MNVVEYDIVNEIIRHPYINQRELAERVGYSVGKAVSYTHLTLPTNSLV